MRAEAVIDLAALRGNIRTLRAGVGPAAVMSVVKADAYGHGMLRCARAALSAGATWLGTATPQEALALRDGGISAARARVLCWLWTPDGPWEPAVRAEIDISVSSQWALAEVVTAARACGRTARVHLKADTGLGRNGCQPHDWPALVAAARSAEAEGLVRVAGVWSHLACAEEPDHPSVRAQLGCYREALALAERLGLRPEVRHLANSAAALTLPETHFDLVRAGLAQYGLSPAPEVADPSGFGLRPVMTLQAQVALVKRVPGGHGVGYGHRYLTPGRSTLALIPLGYADGIPRHASGAGPVQLGGRRHTVAGQIAMDQFVVDVGDGDVGDGDVRAGDTAVLFGPGDQGEPTAQDWALASGTISYEIVTRIGARVPRRYVGDSPSGPGPGGR